MEIKWMEREREYREREEYIINVNDMKTYTAEHVIVCTGENITPTVPTIPDQHLFKGTVLHSSKYTSFLLFSLLVFFLGIRQRKKTHKN